MTARFPLRIALVFYLAVALIQASVILPEESGDPRTHTEYARYIELGVQYRRHIRTGAVDAAVAAAEDQLGLAARIFGKEHAQTAKAFADCAEVYLAKGDYRRAGGYLSEAFDVTERNAESSVAHRELRVSILELAGRRHFLLAQFGQAREHYKAMRVEAAGWSPSVARACLLLGELETELARYDRARAEYECASREKTTRAAAYGGIARVALQRGHFQVARESLERAFAFAAKQDSPDDGARIGIIRLFGDLETAQGSWEAARVRYEQGLGATAGNPGVQADFYRSLSRLYGRRGEMSRAVELAEQAFVHRIRGLGPGHPESAGDLLLRGRHHFAKDEFDLAQEYFLRSLDVVVEAYPGGDAHPQAAAAYLELAMVAAAREDFIGAVESTRNAVKVLAACYPAGHPRNAEAKLELGRALAERGELAAALSELNEALKSRQTLYGEKHPSVAEVWNAIGRLDLRLRGNPSGALQGQRTALSIIRRGESRNASPELLARTYVDLADAHLARGEVKAAMANYEDGLAVYERSGLRGTPDAMRIHERAGSALFSAGRLKKARSHVAAADAIARENGDPAARARLHQLRGQIEERAGRITSALEHYSIAVRLALQGRLERGRHRSRYFARFAPAFDAIVRLELRRGNREAAFRADMQRRGLSIAERFVLFDNLDRAGVPEHDQARLLILADEIESGQSRYARESAAGRVASALTELNRIREVEDRRRKLREDLLQRFPELAQASAAGLHLPTISELQASLREAELLVSFSFAGDRPVAFLVGASRGLQVVELPGTSQALGLVLQNLYTLVSAPEFLRGPYVRIQTPNGELIWNQGDDYDQYEIRAGVAYETRGIEIREKYAGGRRIGKVIGELSRAEASRLTLRLRTRAFTLLVQPVLAAAPSARRLIFSPDGPTYSTPFAALRGHSGRDLAESHIAVLVHSPIIWYRLRNAVSRPTAYPVLAIGNAVYGPGHDMETAATRGSLRGGSKRDMRRRLASLRDGGGTAFDELVWGNLPGTDEEVRAISELAYGDVRRKHTLRGVTADRSVLLSLNRGGQLKDYRFIHFAVHGLQVDGNAALNALVFTNHAEARKQSPGAYNVLRRKYGEASGDGYLRLNEIRSLRLNAELVVLSACETSQGHRLDGEGLVALPQSFLIAGARNVIASSWSVDDLATKDLMQETYRLLLRENATPAEALRAAALRLREKYPDPFYWSAFTVYGE